MPRLVVRKRKRGALESYNDLWLVRVPHKDMLEIAKVLGLSRDEAVADGAVSSTMLKGLVGLAVTAAKAVNKARKKEKTC